MSVLREIGFGVIVLFGGTILGAVLAGVADTTIPELIGGTALGPNSSSSPIMWTGVGAALIVGARGVSA